METILTNLIANLETAFINNADTTIARQQKEYMRGMFEYYGLKAPSRKAICKTYRSDFKSLSPEEFRTLGHYCWEREEREYPYIWIDAMITRKKKLNHKDLSLLEKMIITKSWWDTVDLIASHAIGWIFFTDTKIRNKFLQKWRHSDNIWLKRTCLIFQLKYKDKADFELIKSLILENVHDNEFFIQKACGWALRSHSRIDKEGVVQFISSNDQLSTLCKTEGLKWLKKSGIF